MLCKQEVVGSNPNVSTNISKTRGGDSLTVPLPLALHRGLPARDKVISY